MSITAHFGDCLEIMKNLPDKSIDLFLCDLPFGCLSRSSIGKAAEEKKAFSGNPTGCDWDTKLNLEEFWKQISRLAKSEHSTILHFCTTKFGFDLISSKPSWFRYDLVWNKDRGTSFLTANKLPLRSHEMIYVFSKSGSYYNRIDETGEFTAWKGHSHASKTRTVVEGSGANIANANDGSHRCVKSVITIKKPNTLGHPTEKPLELYKWLISRYCPPGGTVLDPTAGSFNSCFAAFELDREAIGIEKDPEFYKKACAKMDLIG